MQFELPALLLLQSNQMLAISSSRTETKEDMMNSLPILCPNPSSSCTIRCKALTDQNMKSVVQTTDHFVHKF